MINIPMVIRLKLRLLVRYILPIACYLATLLTIENDSGNALEPDKRIQLQVMFGLLILASELGMRFGTVLTIISIILTSLCILFIAIAHGPHITALALITLPGIFLATSKLKPLPGFFLALAPVAALIPTIIPHTVWTTHFPGASPGQIFAILLACSCFIAVGLLSNYSDRQINQQTFELQRLDFAFQKVAESNLDLQTYALFAREEAMEQERRRLAGEIHDIVGFTLTNQQILIQTALAISPKAGKIRMLLETAQSQAAEGLSQARHSLAVLRAKESNRPKGANLFLNLVNQFSQTTGISVEVNFGNLPSSMPVALEHIFYRIIQEGLTNSFRHGKANSVDLHFWYDRDRIYLRMRDYGQAAGRHKNEPSVTSSGIGLAGLRELVEKYGGEFVNGPVEGGYELSASLPCERSEDEV